ncbi:unnamed protein product [Ophioblennius macclurei]
MKRSNKAHQWVDPSFVDLMEEDSSTSAKRKTIWSKSFRREQKKSRSRKPESSLIPKDWKLKQDQNQAWVDRYCPTSLVELAVHKKKVEEVESWLRVHTTTSKGGILLLTGPSGCGKTATVRVLSLELALRIQEWTNPSNLETYASIQQEWRTNGFYSISQLAQFQEFLLRSNKYNCLTMAGEGGAPHRKLILVEDFPNQFYRQPAALHDILRHFVRTSRCPLVFIVSDCVTGDSSSRSLFSREIQEELDISSISFNPVAPTTMMKVLTRISTLEAGQSRGKVCISDPAALEKLCSGSSGDIRSAINSLQFSSLSDWFPEKDLWRLKRHRPVKATRRKASHHTREQVEEQAIGGKDSTLFLFRALGKILHCKRGNPEGREPSSLPSHLSCHHREALLEDPESVVERSHMSGEFFNLYLHQNYLDFFSQLEDVDRASEYLSDADMLMADWKSRNMMEGYSSSVATRGLLHSNSHQVMVGFRPLHKPSWLIVSKKHQENCLAAQSLFRNFCLSPIRLQTELLPYLAKLSNPMRNQAQVTFIQDVGQMPLRRFPDRLKLEMLMDKEPGQLEEEEEKKGEQWKDGQDGAEEGITASQPQATSSQLLLENEDLRIEEYSSD